MSEEYPTTAFALTLAGGIISLIFGIIFIGLGAIVSEYDPYSGSICLVLSFISAFLGIVAALLIKDPKNVHTGGILAIIAAFLSAVGLITLILLLIGGIMALTWKGPEKKTVILPPPPPS